MRITADLIQKCAQYLNPLNEYYIDMRGYKIPFIENLAATNDQFSCIDLTDNEIARLENLPQLLRLVTLILCNNRISKIDATFADMCPKLESLVLTNNKISSFSEIDNLAKSQCGKTLLRLSLNGNLVTNLPNYRAYVVYKLPNLRVLDFQKVSMKEKQAAKKMFEEQGGQQLLKEMKLRQDELESSLHKEAKAVGKKLSLEEEAINRKIQELEKQIEQAQNLEEVNELEKKIKELEDQRQDAVV